MPYVPRHLAAGENPPSVFSQLLANGFPTWTSARTYGLPSGPSSLPARTSLSYNQKTDGSHYQRFINAFALELEILAQACDDIAFGGFLQYPGYTHKSLDTIWEVNLPGGASTVLAVSANLTAKTRTGVNVDGTPILDPNRSVDLQLLQATRLYDFYFGISQVEQFTGAGPYVLSHRVAADTDGTQHVEWITVNGAEVQGFTLAADSRTLSLNAPPASGATVEIHYTTYDLFYQLPDLTKLYVREPFYELLLTVSGPLPPSNGNFNALAANQAIVTPVLFMVWNALDEIGLLLAKPRASGETNALYQRRLVDAVLYPSGPTLTGLRNALATELGLVHHLLWGPGATAPTGLPTTTATASAIGLGTGSVDTDAIRIDKLPLPYYSVTAKRTGTYAVNANSWQYTTVSAATNTAGTIVLSMPVLNPGDTVQLAVQLMASGGTVVPGAVPLQVTTSLPAAQQGIYDEIKVRTRAQSVFSAPALPWISGSLQVFKNGVALVAGTDFTELSSTAFSLAVPAQPGDALQLAYIFPQQSAPPDLEAQADIETDLAPVVRISAAYAADPVLAGTQQFAEWIGVPPGSDPLSLPADGTWTLTFTATNVGSAASSEAAINVTLPPLITWDGQHLSINRQSAVHDVRYIDGAELWVNNLSDAAIKNLLYTSSGAGTPLLKQLAQEITQISPLEWGDVAWDRSIWHSLNERYCQFGFVPGLYDPQYAGELTAQSILYAGTLAGAGSVDTTAPGAAMLGSSVLGAVGNSPFAVSIAPGAAVGAAAAVRYPDFQSGIGYGDDLLTGYATADQLDAQKSVTQRPLANINAAALLSTIPASGADMWLVTVNPGTYYLNQEEHYLFAQPVYAETTTPQLFLEGRQPNTNVLAYRYDATLGLVPLRRTYFTDASGNPTLTVTETCTPVDNKITLQYDDVYNFSILSAADGQSYTPSGSGSNTIFFTACATDLTVSYTLTDSFTVIDDDGGAWFYMDAPKAGGVLVIFEGGSGQMISNMPLHPYYNPRTQGFVYLSANLYLPTTIDVWVDPAAIPADGKTTFNVKVLVTDDYGSGCAGLPVNILVDYREGATAISGVTDAFGYVTADLPAQSSVQVAKVTASVQLTDASGNPLPALLGSTFVELYSPYSG